jgi:glycogen debranching enzyme
MKAIDAEQMFAHASQILEANDLGGYTVPTHGLYPFQWNWDSCLTALGQAYIDEDRAWCEIETLFDNQWEDGMVPHIVFHKHDDGYFPGPEIWATNRPTPTSGITQPPVAGFVVRRLFDRARDKEMARERAGALLPKISKWHEWFYRCRDPHRTGLVAILHPWESGRDNSVDWDEALARVPANGVPDFERRDTSHADPAHRPTHEQYKRYIWLVKHYRELGWDNTRLHDASPFQVVDPGFNAILLRSCLEIAELADHFGEAEIARDNRDWLERGISALETLWSDEYGQYVCYDRAAAIHVASASVGGILPAFAPVGRQRLTALARRIEVLGETVNYLIPSHDASDPRFDALRYWRGPVWLIVNYMVMDGLKRVDEQALCDRIYDDCFALIERSGFAEYHDPIDAVPCGGGRFSWTAAMVIELLMMRRSLGEKVTS